MPSNAPALQGDEHAGGATLFGVGIWNLHVIITHDDGSWFAQAAEIDYAAQGDSIEDVKSRFQQGLCSTIHEHLTVYGNLDQFLQPPPADVWTEIMKAVSHDGGEHQFSQLSLHLVPFTNIEYILPKAA